jgi:hypothetical protein
VSAGLWKIGDIVKVLVDWEARKIDNGSKHSLTYY